MNMKEMMNTQKVTEIVNFLTKNPGYLKRGNANLADKLNTSVEEVQMARLWIKNNIEETIENINDNTSTIKEFDSFLKSNGIKEEDVKSVKFWQTHSGDNRYSVVTKNDSNTLPTIEEVISILTNTQESFVIPKVEAVSENILVVFVSDKHIGALTKKDAIYDNAYDATEFNWRLQGVLKEIGEVYSEEGTLTKIVVVDLGDAMDGYNGETIRGGHKLPQNMSNKEAFEVFVNSHKSFYNALFNSGHAEDYEVYHITNSNHGGEFEHFATRCLQEYLKASYKGVKFDIFEKFITPIVIGEHTYMLSHGKDTEDMKNGLPLTLDAKTEQYIINYMLYHKLQSDNLHFIKGDLHQASTQWGKHFRYRNVPSIYGSSKWIMTNFGYNKPGCSFDLIRGSDIKQWEIWF